MAMSKVISFLSGNEGRDAVFAASSAPHAMVLAEPPAPSKRLRDALKETVPTESLMGQLRDIIMGPQVRLNEAQFDEMLDILEEQKVGNDQRLDFVEQHLGEATEHVTHITSVLEAQDEEISFVKRKLDEQVQALRDEQRELFKELRADIGKSMDELTETLKKRMQGIEVDLRGELLELSGSFVRHVDQDDKRWEDERGHSLATLEQRIAQWRAELDDTRRGDMQNLATSMMDIGRRLMALQGTEIR